ncbi:hypothetical protein LCGC14_0693470 [marine sediment metagenome]|uniref:SCP2 domain-containing protein n=1 Tax=marine sediment metagenome TaxID=412755 RepID=A0A0F9QPQ1_9ZZZZ|nr:MAG: hypothetical protein Lokiarch_03000 [Candidatus Lokiarchaeum sp. GC14_75]
MDNEIKKKLRGLAGVISKLVEPLNEDQKFKETFSDIEVKVLLNATDGEYAALIVIDKGTIHVEGYKNNPKKNLKKKVIDWDGLLQTTTPIFIKFLRSNEISIKKFIGKVLTRKIKIRGIKNVLMLRKVFRI